MNPPPFFLGSPLAGPLPTVVRHQAGRSLVWLSALSFAEFSPLAVKEKREGKGEGERKGRKEERGGEK